MEHFSVAIDIIIWVFMAYDRVLSWLVYSSDNIFHALIETFYLVEIPIHGEKNQQSDFFKEMSVQYKSKFQ